MILCCIEQVPIFECVGLTENFFVKQKKIFYASRLVGRGPSIVIAISHASYS